MGIKGGGEWGDKLIEFPMVILSLTINQWAFKMRAFSDKR